MEENENSLFVLINVSYLNVLDIPSLTIGRGITTIFGPSGSGKTTILKLLNRMISPSTGQLFFNGTELRQTNPVQHRRKVVMLSQNPVMFEGSIGDNLNAPNIFQKRPLLDESLLCSALETVRLGKDPATPVNLLSGGEKQRLALARVILLQPEVYLLDEPSSSLDDASAEAVVETLCLKARKENRPVIMVTHSKTIARKYSDAIITIAGGKSIGQELCSGRDN